MRTDVVIPRSYAEKYEMDRSRPSWFGTLAELLALPPDPPPQRFPVRRSSAGRAPLPKWLRSAVLRRDGFACKVCGWDPNARLEVDHMIPWSAGGPDASWNLRTLCHKDNQERSNWDTHDWDQRLFLPIIGACVECLGRRRGIDHDRDPYAWQEWVESYHGPSGPNQSDLTLAWCDPCRSYRSASFYEIDRSAFQCAVAQETPVDRPHNPDAWWR